MRYYFLYLLVLACSFSAWANKYHFTCPEQLGAEGALAVEKGQRSGLSRAEAWELSRSEEFSERYFKWTELAAWLREAPSTLNEALALGLRSPEFEPENEAVRLQLLDQASQQAGVPIPPGHREPFASVLIHVHATPLKPRDVDGATLDFIKSMKSDDSKMFVKVLAEGIQHRSLGANLWPRIALDIAKGLPQMVIRQSGRRLRADLRRDDRASLIGSDAFRLYCLAIAATFGKAHQDELAKIFFSMGSRNDYLSQHVPQFLEANGLYHPEIKGLRSFFHRLLVYVYGDRQDQKKPISPMQVREQLHGEIERRLRTLRSEYASYRQRQILEERLREVSEVPRVSLPDNSTSPPVRESSATPRGYSRRRLKAQAVADQKEASRAAAIAKPDPDKIFFEAADAIPVSRFSSPEDREAFIEWMDSDSISDEYAQILRVLSHLENGMAFNELGDALTPTREDHHIFRLKTSTKTRVWIARDPRKMGPYVILNWDEQAKASRDRENRGIEEATKKLGRIH